MRVIAKRTLREFWLHHPAARLALQDWHARTSAARWLTPAELKAAFPDVSILKGGRAVFNIRGNRFRLVAQINYAYRVVYIRFIGTHAMYDAIDADTI